MTKMPPMMLKLAMLNEGVDMMGGIGFLTSAAHRDKDIDAITIHRWGATRPGRITYRIGAIILMLP